MNPEPNQLFLVNTLKKKKTLFRSPKNGREKKKECKLKIQKEMRNWKMRKKG